MKRILCTVLAFLMCLCAAAALVACGHDHIASEAWSQDETHHWHVCTQEDCGEQTDKAEHAWDAGVNTLLPTATTDGVRLYTCEVCGKTRTEAVPAQTEVNAEEWANAFLLNEENYRLSISTLEGQSALLIKKRGGVAEVTEPRALENGTRYYTLEGDVYYCYTATDGQATKQAVDRDTYLKAITLVDLQIFAQSAFTYNAESKRYEAAQLTVAGVVYEDVRISFVGKMITGISFTKKVQGKEDEPVVITVTYGTSPVITLPEVTG